MQSEKKIARWQNKIAHEEKNKEYCNDRIAEIDAKLDAMQIWQRSQTLIDKRHTYVVSALQSIEKISDLEIQISVEKQIMGVAN